MARQFSDTGPEAYFSYNKEEGGFLSLCSDSSTLRRARWDEREGGCLDSLCDLRNGMLARQYFIDRDVSEIDRTLFSFVDSRTFMKHTKKAIRVRKTKEKTTLELK